MSTLTLWFGTARRVQALYRWGWPFEAQAENCTLSAAELSALTEPAPISFAVAVAVEDLYDKLSMKVPPATLATEQTRADGAARGWRLPLEWDDDEIDDPAAIPASVTPMTAEANEAWLQNYALLVRQGFSRQQAADLLGTTPKAIKERLVRARAGDYLPAGVPVRSPRTVSPAIPCGSRAAYTRHRRHGEPIDEACRKANTAYERTRSSRQARGPLQPCGTTAAYMRHKRRREPVCQPCLDAWNHYYTGRSAVAA